MAQLRPLVALSLLLLAGLSWLADARPLPRIAPSQAGEWEGQAVIVTGWAVDVNDQANGGQRMQLQQSGHGIDVAAPISDVRGGDWVEATGRLARFSGRLMLLAERLAVTRGQGPADPGWLEVADHIERFVGEPIQLSGTLLDGRLHDGAGHSVEIGAGPWPPDGQATLVGVLTYDAACLCHRFDAVASQWKT